MSVKRAIWSWLLVLVISYTLLFVALMLLIILFVAITYLINPDAFGKISNQLFEDPNSLDAVNDAARGATDALKEGADSLKTK